MIRNFLLLLVTSIVFLGCAEKQTLDMTTKPKYQVQKKIAPPVSNKGSLFTRKGPSLFADKKDLQIGDIVKIQIDIDETIEAKVDRNDQSNYDSTQAAGTFIANNAQSAGTAKKLNSAFGLGFNTASDKEFHANADSTSEDKITDSYISSVVKEVYQNGNFFIQGERETLILGQKLTVKISGVISPYDIGKSDSKFEQNAVNSRDIANLKILYEKDGEEVNIIEKKWGTKLIDAIWPF